MELFTLK